jgi:hypothetical protein
MKAVNFDNWKVDQGEKVLKSLFMDAIGILKSSHPDASIGRKGNVYKGDIFKVAKVVHLKSKRIRIICKLKPKTLIDFLSHVQEI